MQNFIGIFLLQFPWYFIFMLACEVSSSPQFHYLIDIFLLFVFSSVPFAKITVALVRDVVDCFLPERALTFSFVWAIPYCLS
jgi:hypothetical protein